MSQSKPVTESVILHLKQGVSLDDVYAGRKSNDGTPAHELTKLGNMLKAQNGCVRQFWGPQIENQNIFVWTIDWQSFEHHAAFINSEEYKTFMVGVTQVFDLEVAAPLMMHTAFTSDAVAAREAPVTEMAFFMLSKEATEEQKTKLEDDLLPVIKACTTTGKCTAFAVGWVFEDQPHSQASNGQAIALHAILGWSSVDAHQEFRKTQEFLNAIGPVRAAVLTPVQGRAMFHAKLHAGV